MEYGNLLDSFKSLLGQPLAAQASQLLGQPVNGIAGGIDRLLPNLLGAIVQRGSNSNEGAGALRDLLNSSSVDTGLLSNVGDALSGGTQTSALLQQGQSQLSQLFGAKLPNLNEAAASVAGVNGTQAGTLTAAATPFALALFKRALAPNGGVINSGALAGFLDSQKKHFGGLSEAFFGMLGLGSLGAWLAPKAAPTAAKSAAAMAAAGSAAPKKKHKWLLWLILAAIIAALLGWCTQHGSGSGSADQGASAASDASAAAGNDASAAAVAASGDQGASAASDASAAGAASDSGASAAAAASGTDANAGAASGAAAAGASDASANGAVAAGTGAAVAGAGAAASGDAGLPAKFYFATGKAALGAHFQHKASAVVDYAKAHSDAKFAVTGFTDSRGSAQQNIALAKRRADAVVHALAADGVDASRLTVERPASTDQEIGGSGQEGRRVEVSVAQ